MHKIAFSLLKQMVVIILKVVLPLFFDCIACRMHFKWSFFLFVEICLCFASLIFYHDQWSLTTASGGSCPRPRPCTCVRSDPRLGTKTLNLSCWPEYYLQHACVQYVFAIFGLTSTFHLFFFDGTKFKCCFKIYQ